ncbi:L-aspartate oxidase [Azospirillum lipoferum]|uniref:L-aspartate oxidase n=1 Tax=Azospirillum lipoferum TaxID=193 RepID=A0A5A9GI05_AZOLI|nr:MULTISPECIES: L-aspartate oxidase [Azospirillum]KAA0592899.1 L-aspartate oxidase [Azospirillum lipoferum]MCP1614054.1 L-aspartate oxidase [Azospirillum lipoferum]MDW5537556.1 L-aspartate oxidase [Azospirillum sp. NL1]
MTSSTPYDVRDAEVIIVGSGLAGMTAALQLAPRAVTLITKTAGLPGGSSLHAQGGIAAAVGPGDRPEDHAADTVAAGAGLVDAAMAALLTRDGAALVRRLLEDGLPFDRAPDGSPLLGREAAHGAARIVHAGGDATGRTLVTALAERLRATPSVRVETDAFAVDLVLRNGRVCGLLACHAQGWVLHRAPRVILATGGIGAAFARTTNPAEATGDGLAIAARAGARLADLEFVQFHPTALAVDADPVPLLTEALRGAGALLLDSQGHRFMPDEHPLAELAPRDVVARAIGRRVAAGEPVFLDLRPALAAKPNGFPTVLALCAEHGLDPFAEPMPVAPAAHYHMGGVVTDADGRTSLEGLWACGEVACTGVHGANRLASNSLLEALVFGARVARDVAERPLAALPPFALPRPPAVAADVGHLLLDAIGTEARTALYQGAGLVRDGLGLLAARRKLDRLATALDMLRCEEGDEAPPEIVRKWGEARNRLLVGRLVVHAALAREESRGAHCRSDHPLPNPATISRTLTLSDLAGTAGPLSGDAACCIL